MIPFTDQQFDASLVQLEDIRFVNVSVDSGMVCMAFVSVCCAECVLVATLSSIRFIRECAFDKREPCITA
jgi:hypothetical protein